MKTQESRFKIYLNFILKLLSLQLGLLQINNKFQKLWNNKSKK